VLKTTLFCYDKQGGFFYKAQSSFLDILHHKKQKMNYLAHAYLSFGHAQILLGNMIGDFVKGTEAQMDIYPKAVKQGLILHRQIDSFTDQHSAIREAKKIFRPKYGLYSGAVVDTLMDHFIANDASLFANEPALDYFVQQVYKQLGDQQVHFPEKFVPYYESMIAHNWLFHYRNEYGIQRSLNGLMRKAKHIDEVDTAFELLLMKKDTLQDLYQQFMWEMISFVKITMEKD
jgi:acyl carrier protein phosphodiesterase